MRVRVAGIVPMDGGYALMHRTNNMESVIHDYYVFPGGGLEENESIQEGTEREIKEEFGINVKAKEILYEMDGGIRNDKEYFLLCEYVSGILGTGDGPEFNNDPKYANRGQFIPTIVYKEELDNLLILPESIKNEFIKDVKNGKF